MNIDYRSGRKYHKGYKTSDFTRSPAYAYMIEDYLIKEIKDGEVKRLRCRNVLHHIRPNDLPKVFNEFSRLLCDGGELIISEPREEYFKQNKILDLIWYRFLYDDRKIYIPEYYVNFEDYINKEVFKRTSHKIDIKNDVITYKKVK